MRSIKIIFFILCLVLSFQVKSFWVVGSSDHGSIARDGLLLYKYTPSSQYFKNYLNSQEFEQLYGYNNRTCTGNNCTFYFRQLHKISSYDESIDWDETTKDNPSYHCDNEKITQCSRKVYISSVKINLFLQKIIKELKQKSLTSSPIDFEYYREQFTVYQKLFGRSLHTLQDFYSHSNWVERELYKGSKVIRFDDEFREKEGVVDINSDFGTRDYREPKSTGHACITGPSFIQKGTIPRYNVLYLSSLVTGYYEDNYNMYDLGGDREYCNVPGLDSDMLCDLPNSGSQKLGFILGYFDKSKNAPHFIGNTEKCIHSEKSNFSSYVGIAKDNPFVANTNIFSKHHEVAAKTAEEATKKYMENIVKDVVGAQGDGMYTDWAILTFLGYKVEISPCNSDYSLVYSLNRKHPSGYLASSGNKILMNKQCFKNKEVKILKREILGGFKNRPDQYDVDYNYDNKPFNGYSGYSYYKGTKYEGLHEREMYVSSSYSELIKKIELGINSNQCKFLADNFSGGRLNRDDNMWTTFCPKTGLVSALNSLWGEEK